ncbi:transcriptional regulator with XRE-family HTH domain [Variovorax boronicumulans]|uniref:helix-turn-helix domain-containing protein n=1 Tax=Variovorax boronicumulans TaxID=436515 RepID=UPI00277F1D17|nr:helix-turn-helix transcriptional regulator [Variovorax boronicumulans]MDQ0074230.1 transcriptional regulator with XRE-family HTH domain [Variovorax boronicumulans]
MQPAAPPTFQATSRRLEAFGRRIHARRKALKISAVTTAEAAGMSRMTLHRIERGEPSVTMGAYMNALAALGLDVEVVAPDDRPANDVAAPASARAPTQTVRVADFAQLRRLAWQLPANAELTPEEAWGTYERNWRHADPSALEDNERQLLAELAHTLGRKPLDV